MKPCKRVELVIEEPIKRRLEKVLSGTGMPGYTVIPRASGRGDRGLRRGDEPTGTSTNCVFIIACDDDSQVSLVVEAIRPVLSKYGGICLVSDAMWLKH